MPGIKEKNIMTSALQGHFEPDSQNTDKLIKTAVVNLLSWCFHDWLGIIKSPSCESLKLYWLAERILMSKSGKIVLVCKIHKNDIIRLKLCQKVQLFISACNMNIFTVLDFELLRETILWHHFCLVCKIHKMTEKNWKHAENDLSSSEVSKYV